MTGTVALPEPLNCLAFGIEIASAARLRGAGSSPPTRAEAALTRWSKIVLPSKGPFLRACTLAHILLVRPAAPCNSLDKGGDLCLTCIVWV